MHSAVAATAGWVPHAAHRANAAAVAVGGTAAAASCLPISLAHSLQQGWHQSAIQAAALQGGAAVSPQDCQLLMRAALQCSAAFLTAAKAAGKQ